MKNKVWIMNHYAGNMFFNRGGRHYWFAKFLHKAGYEPAVFCSNARHNGNSEVFYNFKTLWEEHCDENIHTSFIFIKNRTYKRNGLQRILNMTEFFFNLKKAAKEYAKINGKPDIIYASSVHPLTLVAGIQLAREFGVRCICEARDLWPEAIVNYSNKLRRFKLLTALLYRGEKWIYQNADALIFTQEGGADYIRSHKWDIENGGSINMNKVYHINNGVDLEAFIENKKRYIFNDADLENKDSFKVIYTGAIRRINNLGIILDTAKEIEDPKIKFLIYGAGDELENLKERQKREGVNNVVFKGFVKKCYIPGIVSKADLNLVHWEMSPLLRVGESYNKAFEYYAAGKPVLYTVRPGYSIAEKYRCGKLPTGYTPKELAKDIEFMKNLTEVEKQIMAENALKVAHDYDFKVLTDKLIEIIENA